LPYFLSWKSLPQEHSTRAQLIADLHSYEKSMKTRTGRRRTRKALVSPTLTADRKSLCSASLLPALGVAHLVMCSPAEEQPVVHG
jgi:hypothetical protein